jgi:hypothetical protein
MQLGVLLGGRFGVMLGMQMMGMREMSVMGGFLMLFAFGVLHRLMVMMRSLLMMLGGAPVVIDGGVMFAHERLLMAPHRAVHPAIGERHVVSITPR